MISQDVDFKTKHFVSLMQVSPAKKGRAGLSGGTAALPRGEEPRAARQGGVGRTGNPVRQRPSN